MWVRCLRGGPAAGGAEGRAGTISRAAAPPGGEACPAELGREKEVWQSSQKGAFAGFSYPQSGQAIRATAYLRSTLTAACSASGTWKNSFSVKWKREAMMLVGTDCILVL